MDEDATGGATIASFRTYALYRAQILLIFAVFSVVGLFLAGSVFVDFSWGTVAPAVGWWAILAWNGNLLLFRYAYRIEATEYELRWWAPLRRGRIPISAVRAVRSQRFGSSTVVIEAYGVKDVRTFGRRGIMEFTEELVRLAPDGQVEFGWQMRIGHRWGPSGFRQGR